MTALISLRCVGCSLRQRAHLGGHYCEAASLLARARRLHGGVQRQQICLEGDAVDQRGDVGDLAVALGDAIHGRDHLRHDFAAALALSEASEASLFAWLAFSAFSFTVLESSSTLAAVSSRLVACSSVRRDRSLLPMPRFRGLRC